MKYWSCKIVANMHLHGNKPIKDGFWRDHPWTSMRAVSHCMLIIHIVGNLSIERNRLWVSNCLQKTLAWYGKTILGWMDYTGESLDIMATFPAFHFRNQAKKSLEAVVWSGPQPPWHSEKLFETWHSARYKCYSKSIIILQVFDVTRCQGNSPIVNLSWS